MKTETQTGVAILTPTEQVNKALAEKGITETLIRELEKHKLLTVDVKTEDGVVIYNKEQLGIAKAALKATRDTRIFVEKTCKSQRDVWNAMAKENIAKEKEFVGLLNPVESHLQTITKSVEQAEETVRIIEEQKKEEVYKVRVNLLVENGMAATPFGDGFVFGELNIKTTDLRSVNDEAFEHFLSLVKEKFEADKAAKEGEAKKQMEIRVQQEAEAARLETIRKEQEAREKAIAEAEAKLEAEKKAREDAKRKEEETKQREIELQKAREEAAAKAIADEKIRVENERIKAEAKAKRDAIEAEEKAKADELARIEAEKKAAEKEAKRLARLPDKTKLLAFADQLSMIDMPEVKSAEAKNILIAAKSEYSKMIDNLRVQANSL